MLPLVRKGDETQLRPMGDVGEVQLRQGLSDFRSALGQDTALQVRPTVLTNSNYPGVSAPSKLKFNVPSS